MEWMQQAACRGQGTNLFFPERGTSAKRVVEEFCAGCPVRDRCADAGLREMFGIWGGRSERSRRRTRVELGVKPQYRVAPCGTAAGYKRHQRRGEPACRACIEAKRVDNALRQTAPRQRAAKAV